ncbi:MULTISPECIES: Ldh family oxidoreductase [unclassified Iodidimonas]|jgi:(2R)-3-sulfolactate dehydrogenase (NADP+)|uniref:Ldh family oxidoreductase n=1 Tax=unclassified Iodidimonas TaxID=2626145 RepID=UPI002482324D|nr:MULTISPECIES: Ldh family oxidoreductase [unclassified Iodidimonas]
MTEPVRLSLDAAQDLVARALLAAGCAPEQAAITARALVTAEADGQAGHGLSRVPSYAAQAKSGKVNGHAVPHAQSVSPAALRIDAGFGFAYPALDLAVAKLVQLAPTMGIASATLYRSHHFGQAGAHAEKLAHAGLIGLVFGNSPKAIAFWGGQAPMLGTNPVAFAAPLPEGPPLVIDFAVSVVARGKINAAKQAGETIPEGWALDRDGQPTTDPDAALAGSMLPIGGAKGAALAMMIEILAAALSGSHFGFEASSLFDGEGPPPDLGQTLLAIDPMRLSAGAYQDRMAVFLAALGADAEVRLPGSRRLINRQRAAENGLLVPATLFQSLQELAASAA